MSSYFVLLYHGERYEEIFPISVHNDLESALEKARGKIKEDKIEAGFEEEVSIEPKIKKREKEWRVSWTKSDSDCYQIFEIDK